MYVLHARSLDAYSHRRAHSVHSPRLRYQDSVDITIKPTLWCPNPFVLRFRRRRRRRPRRLSRSRRAASLVPVAPCSLFSSENFAFSSLFPPCPLDPFRDLPSEVFGFLNANGTTRASRDRIRITLPAKSLIGRSPEDDRVLRVCHFMATFHPAPLPTIRPQGG